MTDTPKTVQTVSYVHPETFACYNAEVLEVNGDTVKIGKLTPLYKSSPALSEQETHKDNLWPDEFAALIISNDLKNYRHRIKYTEEQEI